MLTDYDTWHLNSLVKSRKPPRFKTLQKKKNRCGYQQLNHSSDLRPLEQLLLCDIIYIYSVYDQSEQDLLFSDNIPQTCKIISYENFVLNFEKCPFLYCRTLFTQ